MTRWVFWDYETFVIQPGMQAPPPVCMVYATDYESPQLDVAWSQSFWDRLWGWIADDHTILVAHNAAFEFVVTLAARPEWAEALFAKVDKGLWRCTLLRDKLIRIARGEALGEYNLDACLKYWALPIELDKQAYWRPRYGLLWGVPVEQWPQDALNYVLGDIAVRDLYLVQEKNGAPWLPNQDAQAQAGVALQLTSAWGFPTDLEAALQLERETVAKIESAKESLLEKGLVRWKKEKGEFKLARNIKAASDYMIRACESRGLEVKRNPPTEAMQEKGLEEGSVALSAEACEASQDPVMEDYALFTSATTLLSKVRRLQKPLIQTSYDVLKATGRTSSRGGKDPKPGEPFMAWGTNIQNMNRAGDEE